MFYAAALLLPVLFVVVVWLFFSQADWPQHMTARALVASGASVVLSLAFGTVLLGAVGRAYVRLGDALRTVRRQNLQLRALHQAGLALNEELDLPSVLSRLVGLSRHVLDVASADLVLAEPEAPAEAGARAAAPRDATRLSVPVRFHDELLATLELARPGRPFEAEERVTAERFATRAGAAIANARLLDTVRQLGGAAERERIARELHDGTVQALYGLSLEMRAALMDAVETPAVLDPAMRGALERIGEILGGIRAYVSESAHAERDHSDLETALRGAVEPIVAGGAAAVAWRSELDAPLALPSGAVHEVAQVVREAVANAVRHGEAEHVVITTSVRGATLVLEVRDDGHGFDPRAPRSDGHGLRNMGMRMRILGGDLRVESNVGRGTRVVARLPWAAAAERTAVGARVLNA